MSRKLALVVVVAACVSKPGKCPMASFKLAYDNGSAQWSYDTVSGSVALAQVPNTECNGGFTGTARWNPNDTQAQLDGSVSLACRSGDHQFGVSVYLDNVGATAAGTTQVPVAYSYMIPGQSDQHTCDGTGMATVTVRDVAGGTAPTPDLVTPDFTRTFDVHIDGSMPVTGKAIDKPCSSISIELSTTVKLEAGDVDSEPNYTCPALG